MPEGDSRVQRVVIETSRHRIVGNVTLPREGMQTRLTDLLNREGMNFVALVDAQITDLDGRTERARPFVAVGLDHIQLAYEES